MYVVIMAGGKGTRIASVASGVPKPMIPVCGKPILQYQVENFSQCGFKDFIFVTGHLREKIKEYFGDGSYFGVNITYFEETVPLGTAGALPYLKDKIGEDDFFLVNGDIMLDVDFNRFLQFHKEKNADASIIVHPNSHPFDSSLVIADENGKVTDWLHKEDTRELYRNAVNAGVHILSYRAFAYFPDGREKIDLDRDVFRNMISSGKLYAYYSPEYIKDMGTPERYKAICDDVRTNFTSMRNLSKKQKSIFLDRDGTINKYKGFITAANEFELIDGVADAIKEINSKGYLAIVVTNQPVIARGECTFEELNRIHMKMETLLGEKGAYIDAIYFCPHHPDKGFAGERPEFKMKCICRKPEPGMLLEAAADFNIDLSASWMIGDDEKDIQAGKNAGCKTAFIGKISKIEPTEYCASLVEFSKNLKNIAEV